MDIEIRNAVHNFTEFILRFYSTFSTVKNRLDTTQDDIQKIKNELSLLKEDILNIKSNLELQK